TTSRPTASPAWPTDGRAWRERGSAQLAGRRPGRVASLPMAGSLLVGIAGGSGSGKTTIARKLAATFGPHELTVIPLDAYYRDRRDQSPAERARINYDHPEAFDQTLLLEHLAALK